MLSTDETDEAPRTFKETEYGPAISQLGSLAASLGGLDALVFTAGIGENSAMIRRRVCRAASWLGVELDEDANLID